MGVVLLGGHQPIVFDEGLQQWERHRLGNLAGFIVVVRSARRCELFRGGVVYSRLFSQWKRPPLSRCQTLNQAVVQCTPATSDRMQLAAIPSACLHQILRNFVPTDPTFLLPAAMDAGATPSAWRDEGRVQVSGYRIASSFATLALFSIRERNPSMVEETI